MAVAVAAVTAVEAVVVTAVAVADSTAGDLEQAAQRFIQAAFGPVARQSEAARFTRAPLSIAVACGSLTGIISIDGSSERPIIRITTTTPIIIRTAAARSSGPITVRAASVTSATGGTITGVTIAGTVTIIASIGEHRADRRNESGAQRRPTHIPCSD